MSTLPRGEPAKGAAGLGPSPQRPTLGSEPPDRLGSSQVWLVVLLAHVASTLWLFGGVFSSGRLLFFRDLSTSYAPWYFFASESLRKGVWPLWNPTVSAGEPFLLAYPVDLVLLLAGGWRAPLGIGPALHLLLALAGGSWLARRLGMGPWGAWLTGTVYGLGGTVLSFVNLLQLLHAASWAPWVIAAFVSLVRRPSRRGIACLAALAAIQLSTLGAEIVLMTALFSVVLAWRRHWLRQGRLVALLVTLVTATALALPALLGAGALVQGTTRARGFPLPEALAFSLHPIALLESFLPFWLGDPHGFSDADYWGRAFFPEGYPYLLTLYLGVPVLLLAALARGRLRLWAFAMVGVVLALGSYGPLGLLPRDLSFPLRGPQKLVFLSHLALALLAGFGIESRLGEGSRGVLSRRWSLVLPGAIAAALALAVGVAPQVVRLSAARVIPELLDDRGAVVARATWPVAWLPAGALTLGAGLALALGGRWVRVAAVVVAIDLLIVNGRVNPLAPASFYDLRPDLARLVGQARDGARMFSYGVARTPGLRFEPIMTRAPSDVWLYYLDRQSLLPVTCVLDGMDAAPDEDRTGWAPLGAALTSGAVVPSRFREHHRQLRLAGVGWVLSFAEIPEDLSIIRGRQKLPEVAAPLTLFELRDALPRAFYVAERRIEPDAAQAAAILAGPDFDPARTVLLASDRHSPPPLAHAWRAAPVVRYQPVDAHTLRITARTPPGYIVVLDGYHPDWRADDGLGPVPVLRADGRYRAIPTPGGAHTFTMRFRPSWRLPALLACAVGCLALVLLFLLGRVELRGDPASAHARLAAEG